MMPAWYRPPAYSAVTDMELVAQVARAHSLTAADLIGPVKTRSICIVRWRAMKALRDKGRSLASIGRTLKRDHKTVSHGLERAG